MDCWVSAIWARGGMAGPLTLERTPNATSRPRLATWLCARSRSANQRSSPSSLTGRRTAGWWSPGWQAGSSVRCRGTNTDSPVGRAPTHRYDDPPGPGDDAVALMLDHSCHARDVGPGRRPRSPGDRRGDRAAPGSVPRYRPGPDPWRRHRRPPGIRGPSDPGFRARVRGTRRPHHADHTTPLSQGPHRPPSYGPVGNVAPPTTPAVHRPFASVPQDHRRVGGNQGGAGGAGCRCRTRSRGGSGRSRY